MSEYEVCWETLSFYLSLYCVLACDRVVRNVSPPAHVSLDALLSLTLDWVLLILHVSPLRDHEAGRAGCIPTCPCHS